MDVISRVYILIVILFLPAKINADFIFNSNIYNTSLSGYNFIYTKTEGSLLDEFEEELNRVRLFTANLTNEILYQLVIYRDYIMISTESEPTSIEAKSGVVDPQSLENRYGIYNLELKRAAFVGYLVPIKVSIIPTEEIGVAAIDDLEILAFYSYIDTRKGDDIIKIYPLSTLIHNKAMIMSAATALPKSSFGVGVMQDIKDSTNDGTYTFFVIPNEVNRLTSQLSANN